MSMVCLTCLSYSFCIFQMMTEVDIYVILLWNRATAKIKPFNVIIIIVIVIFIISLIIIIIIIIPLIIIIIIISNHLSPLLGGGVTAAAAAASLLILSVSCGGVCPLLTTWGSAAGGLGELEALALAAAAAEAETDWRAEEMLPRMMFSRWRRKLGVWSMEDTRRCSTMPCTYAMRRLSC